VPAFEVILHLEGVDLDAPEVCTLARKALRKGFELGSLVPNEWIDLKGCIRIKPLSEKDARRIVEELLNQLVEIVEASRIRFRSVSVSGWCHGDDEFCKPYWCALHELSDSVVDYLLRRAV